jgi:hypothetical protein
MERLQFAFAHRYVRRAAVAGLAHATRRATWRISRRAIIARAFPQPITGVDVLSVDVGDT